MLIPGLLVELFGVLGNLGISSFVIVIFLAFVTQDGLRDRLNQSRSGADNLMMPYDKYWTALGKFLLTLLLLYPTAAEARLSEPDWTELDKQIDDGQWCQEGDHCRRRYYSTEEDEEEKWKEMEFDAPSDMDERELV